MKNRLAIACAIALLPISSLSNAQETGSAISGSLSFDLNTHFISYGADVWGTGDDIDKIIANPSVSFNIALSESNYLILGAWADINDYAESSLGGDIQEIDLWVGYGTSIGGVSVELIYQEWIYGGEIERVVDLVLGFDAPFNPSLTIHGRVDGNGGQEEGVVVVLGAGYDIPLEGPLSLSIPVSVAAATDDFHGGDSGYAYSTIGLSASLPLGVPDKYGAWNLHGAVTLYHTNDDVIPGNPDDTFITANIGIGLDF